MSALAPASPTPRSRLRTRLLAFFVLLAVPPVLALALLLNALVARRFEEMAHRRLEAALAASKDRFDALRREAETKVRAVAEDDLPEAGEREARLVASAIAPARGLTALEIVDAEGYVVSSHHWPAGFGLPDPDHDIAPGSAWRFETVAEGYGSARRLALVATRAARWKGAPATVRGGLFVDGSLLAGLSGLLGMQAAIYDAESAHWIAPSGSVLLAWSGSPPAEAGGDVRLGGERYDWAAAAVAPSLRLVVAVPRTALEAMTADVRRSSALIAGAALALALLGAIVLSSSLARPVRELAEGARRVAGGDLETQVEPSSADEVGELARAFNAMTGELRASRERLLQAERVAAWREMARRLAHELKNPLFPIQVSVETLQRAFARSERNDALATLVIESTATILEELRALRRTVDEFAEFARMPRPRLQPMDLNQVMGRALDLHEPRAGEVAIIREPSPEPLRLIGDPDLLARALGNLVANALEAMPTGGTLTVRTRGDGRAAILEVEDTGPGLGEEERARLFTPYYTTKKGGTGLGLAIVQGIVSDHGGRIDVRSAPGSGTLFTLVLPRSASGQM